MKFGRLIGSSVEIKIHGFTMDFAGIRSTPSSWVNLVIFPFLSHANHSPRLGG